MGKSWFSVGVWLLLVCVALCGSTVKAFALEEGEITGKIERTNDKFLRDYESLEYGTKKDWKEWGQGRRSLGWIVVQGDSGDLKDYVLLVIDTHTEIESKDSEKRGFSDLGPGSRIRAKYRMGWDALHALHVKKLDD
jgi:hypothetical protein